MIHTRNILLLLFTAIMLNSCIKVYDPNIEESDTRKLVVSGVLTDLNGDQKFTISMSSSINDPQEVPLPGCAVTISDDKGHLFPLADSSNGNYYGKINVSYLTPGSSFKIEIITPGGDKIISDYDQFSSCPDVDSVYYTRKNLPTSNPDEFTEGIQFYVDLNGETTDSRYYRWEAIETYEYHSDYPIEWYYDGVRVKHTFPPDYSKDTCWATLMIRNVYTKTTENLAENKYRQFPMNFVDNTTSRLLYGYSLQVKQYSLSETAYKYWKQLQANSAEEGGLYERQPMASQGNLHNLTHPDKEVLGYFGVSSVKSKRIFVRKVENLKIKFLSFCIPKPMSKWGFADYVHLPKPLYLFGDYKGYQMILMNVECVDCTSMWGKNVKPDFWPN